MIYVSITQRETHGIMVKSIQVSSELIFALVIVFVFRTVGFFLSLIKSIMINRSVPWVQGAWSPKAQKNSTRKENKALVSASHDLFHPFQFISPFVRLTLEL